MAFDFTDFYILYDGVPKYNSAELVEDDLIRVIIQKYQLIIFTIQGEVFGEPEFGANLDRLLFETNVSESAVKEEILSQLATYAPEIYNTNFDMNIVFVQDPENYQDMMFINLTLNDYDIITQIGRMT
jgi:phage baseplate assembly protein W